MGLWAPLCQSRTPKASERCPRISFSFTHIDFDYSREATVFHFDHCRQANENIRIPSFSFLFLFFFFFKFPGLFRYYEVISAESVGQKGCSTSALLICFLNSNGLPLLLSLSSWDYIRISFVCY